MEFFIAPASSKAKHKISKYGFSLLDVVVIFAFIILAIVLTLAWYGAFKFTVGFYILTPITVIAIIALLVYLMLGTKTNNLGKRNYQVLPSKIKARFNKKLITLQDAKEIVFSFEIKNGKLYDIKNNQYITVYEVNGDELTMFSDNERDNKIAYYLQALKSLDSSIKLISIDEAFGEQDLDLKLKNIKPSNQKVFQLYKNVARQSVADNQESSNKHFYFLSSSKSLNDPNAGFFNNLRQVTTLTLVDDEKKLLNLANGIFVSVNNKKKLYSDSFKDFINWNDLEKIEFKKDYFILNGEYHKILNVYTYPLMNQYCWLRNVITFPTVTGLLDISPISVAQRNEVLQKHRLTLLANRQFINKHIEQAEEQLNIERIEALVNDLLNDSSLCLMKLSSTVVIHANSYKDLVDKEAFIKNDLRQQGYEFNNYFNQQAEVFKALMKFNNNANNLFLSNEITNEALAGGWPFSSNMFNDPKGIYLGTDKFNNAKVFLDLSIVDANQKRNSHNALVCGTTGSGKTFICSYFLAFHLLNGNQAIVFDPLHDYFGFQKYFKTKILDAGSGKDCKINILQCFDRIYDVKDHLAFVQKLFETLRPEIREISAAIFKSLLLLFKKKKLLNKAASSTKGWPTLSDYHKLVCKTSSKALDITNDEHLILKNFTYELAEGRYSNLWNGFTNFNITSDSLIIIDTATLEKNSQAIIDTQMSLITNFVSQALWANSVRNKKNKTKNWINVLFDEAHRFINPNQKVASDMILKFAKEIRHFDGSLILSTQNFADFKSEQAKKVLSQIIYRFIKCVSAEDAAEFAQMLSEVKPITESELQEICNLSKSELVVNVGDMKTSLVMPDLKEFSEVWENEFKPNK